MASSERAATVPVATDGGGLRRWLGSFVPAAQAIDARERLRIAVGAGLGVLVTALLCQWLAPAGNPAWPWLVAPLGASAVLVFGVPSSPLAQPWAVLGGNGLSALVGIACVRWIEPPAVAAAVGVGAAIALMLALRCLHPPGGASALLTVLAGVSDPSFALFPVAVNSLLLVAAGIAYNRATGRDYPHRQRAAAPAPKAAGEDPLDADIDAVVARWNQVLDIGHDDLKALLEDTRLQTYQRKLADLRCADIMSRDPVVVRRETPLHEAWELFRKHRIKALPVVDHSRHIIGIVTPADFMRTAEIQGGDGFEARLRKLRDWTRRDAARKPERVGEIMTRSVRVTRVDRHLADLVPLFGSSGHHHIPVLAEDDTLAGIITQSDLVAALARPQPRTDRAAPTLTP
ncbi:MAG: HPP family protein [Burkholderiaceae bacterium]